MWSRPWGGACERFTPPPPHPWERRLMAYWTCVLPGRNAKHPLKTIHLRAGRPQPQVPPNWEPSNEGSIKKVMTRMWNGGEKIPRSPDRKPSKVRRLEFIWPSPQANVTNDTYRAGNISLSTELPDCGGCKRREKEMRGEMRNETTETLNKHARAHKADRCGFCTTTETGAVFYHNLQLVERKRARQTETSGFLERHWHTTERESKFNQKFWEKFAVI